MAPCPEQVWLGLTGETEQMTVHSGSEFCDLRTSKIRGFILPGYFLCSLTRPHPPLSVEFSRCQLLREQW